jgi:hypothetical protein
MIFLLVRINSYVQAQTFSPSRHVNSTCFSGKTYTQQSLILPHKSKPFLSVPSHTVQVLRKQETDFQLSSLHKLLNNILLKEKYKPKIYK